MIRHDFTCDACGRTEYDVTSADGMKNCICGSRMVILWHYAPRPYIGIHSRDRAVVWYHPESGRHATPGQNNIAMPERYRKAGYERREFETLKSLDSYCTSHNLVNEASNYNSGNSYDNEE